MTNKLYFIDNISEALYPSYIWHLNNSIEFVQVAQIYLSIGELHQFVNCLLRPSFTNLEQSWIMSVP